MPLKEERSQFTSKQRSEVENWLLFVYIIFVSGIKWLYSFIKEKKSLSDFAVCVTDAAQDEEAAWCLGTNMTPFTEQVWRVGSWLCIAE